jgi:hypothetical protein
MEAVIKNSYSYELQYVELIINHLITKYQKGFMKHRSCLTNLLESFEIRNKVLDEGCATRYNFLDLSEGHRQLGYLMKYLHINFAN